MNAIILAAGKGTRLQPFTKFLPKSMFVLGKDVSILSRTISQLQSYIDGRIVVAVGYMKEFFSCFAEQCKLIYNPFYAISNSITSLWFCREYLDDDVIIINADVVLETKLVDYIFKQDEQAFVCVDFTRAKKGDYCVVVEGERVIMMGKELSNSDAEYVGVTVLKKPMAQVLKKCVEHMIENEQINEWFENALVHMILYDDFLLKYLDVAHFKWVEVDSIDDFLQARIIYRYEKE